MTQFIKKFIGEISLTIGIALSVYGVFNFDSYDTRREGLVVYYYDRNIILLITIGALLITIGSLIIKNRKS